MATYKSDAEYLSDSRIRIYARVEATASDGRATVEERDARVFDRAAPAREYAMQLARKYRLQWRNNFHGSHKQLAAGEKASVWMSLARQYADTPDLP